MIRTNIIRAEVLDGDGRIERIRAEIIRQHRETNDLAEVEYWLRASIEAVVKCAVVRADREIIEKRIEREMDSEA